MSNKISELIKLVQKLPEQHVDEVLKIVEKIIDNTEITETEIPDCPHCGATKNLVVKFGKNGDKQRFRCNSCRKYFSNSTKSTVESSRFGEAVWKQVIRDTLNGISLDKTSENLNITHVTSFNMRHKILAALEAFETLEPTMFSGVCEVDDTYVLESVKGTKIGENYHREPRKHGAKASKRGLSNEQVSIMAGMERGGQIYAKTANRATPSRNDITEIFGEHIAPKTLVLCDGAKGFNALNDVAEVVNAKNESGSFFNINSVNGFHSFVKTRHNHIYRGVATKYLNRYNALFSLAYARDTEECTEWVYNILIDKSGCYRKTANIVKTADILDLGQLVNL